MGISPVLYLRPASIRHLDRKPITLQRSTGRVEDLVAIAQSEEGRQQLLDSPQLLQVAKQLSSLAQCWQEGARLQNGSSQEVLQLVRILRNVCACGPKAALLIIAERSHEHAAQLVALSGACSSQIAKVAAQLLANLSASGSAEAAAVWSACWPAAFTAMAADSSEALRGHMAMILCNCCTASEALATITSENGCAIFMPLFQQFAAPEEIGDAHLEMLVSALSIQTGSLPSLPLAERPFCILTDLKDWHPGVLGAVTKAIDARTSNHLKRLSSGKCHELAACVLEAADWLARQPGELLSRETAFLQASFQFLRTVTAADDELISLANGTQVTHHLIEAGLAAKLLAILAALGPLKSSRPNGQPVKGWPDCEHISARTAYFQRQRYLGQRTDILTVLANAAYRRQAVQEQVMELGGIELTLAHCQVCEENPLLREAALWCVRNLCEGNLAVQRHIEELQVVETVQSPELAAAGMQLQHDPLSGRIHLIDNMND